MRKIAISALKDGRQKDVVKLFGTLEGKYSLWPLWCDFVTMAACEFSFIDENRRERRIDMYNKTAAKYTEKERLVFAEILGNVVNAFEDNPDQDFLGQLYMAMNLGNDHTGQFFTPYCVCLMMAKMNLGNPAGEIAEKGWIRVNDPCCGAGAMLIAHANALREQGVNYQQHVLYIGQDIDFVVAMMCYIQLSLLGCAGYIAVGCTFRSPVTEATVHDPEREVWIMPMYFHEIWSWRRAFRTAGRITELTAEPAATADVEDMDAPPMFAETKGGQLTLF